MNRKLLLVLLAGYSVVVAVSCVFPVGLSDMEWHSFYAYLDKHGAVPYVDSREGYPPLGFLVYTPFYYAFRDNVTAFAYCFRVLNGTFLVAVLFTFYLITKSLHDEERALQLSLCYAVLPSVLIANTYSNDVVALLPAALAIFMMVKKKALPCGLLLGLATLGKGFPALLLIPALVAFTDLRDRVKLAGSMVFVLVFVSLPFVLVNPLTYLSTFTHVGSRGPWETVWAIGDGYYSHGGLLHPFFDKFFYHFNLLKIYPASHFDHAIYTWNFDQLPNLLTFLQVVTVIVISLAYLGRKKDAVPLCGFMYIGYMLFFKGYSTQFAVSTPFYVLLATAAGIPLAFLIPLEVSHILQIFAWNSQAFAPEFLRNEHLPILLSAVVVRSIVFVSLMAVAFRDSHFSFKPLASATRRLVPYLKLFRDKWLVLAVSATLVMALISAAPLYSYMNGDEGFRSFKGKIEVTQSGWQSIVIDGLEKGDQVMIRLDSGTWFDTELADSAVDVEQGFRNPYNLKDSFNETMLFFRADSESCSLMLRMKHARMPFKIIEGLESDLCVNVTSEDPALRLGFHDTGIDGNASMFTMAYPISTRIDNNFTLKLKYQVAEGSTPNILVYVFDDTDEWLYPFAASEDFVLTPETKDLYDQANLLGDNISLVEVSMVVNDNTSTVVRLEEFSVSGYEKYSVKLHAAATEEVSYDVCIERDFKPSVTYAAAFMVTVALGASTIWYAYRKVGCTRRTDESWQGKNILNVP